MPLNQVKRFLGRSAATRNRAGENIYLKTPTSIDLTEKLRDRSKKGKEEAMTISDDSAIISDLAFNLEEEDRNRFLEELETSEDPSQVIEKYLKKIRPEEEEFLGDVEDLDGLEALSSEDFAKFSQPVTDPVPSL